MTRARHDDTGPPLSPEDTQVQGSLIDTEALVDQAITKLRNLAAKRADAKRRFFLEQRSQQLAEWVRALRASRKEAGL